MRECGMNSNGYTIYRIYFDVLVARWHAHGWFATCMPSFEDFLLESPPIEMPTLSLEPATEMLSLDGRREIGLIEMLSLDGRREIGLPGGDGLSSTRGASPSEDSIFANSW